MAVTKGLLTYEAEGMEGGTFHSRKLHVPSGSSGLTLGRGYDMKEKSRRKIETELSTTGVANEKAKVLAYAAELSGNQAKQFIVNNELQDFEISTETQEALFCISYEEMSEDVWRICNKSDCVKLYGKVDWNELNNTIKEVIIDLRYRVDYTPSSRKLIQKIVAENDIEQFILMLSTRELWAQVPEDRFNRRVDFLLEVKN